MSTSPMQIRVDADVKRQASALFNELGLDMSSAVNIFLRQCILHGGLPFPVELPAGQPHSAMSDDLTEPAEPHQPSPVQQNNPTGVIPTRHLTVDLL